MSRSDSALRRLAGGWAAVGLLASAATLAGCDGSSDESGATAVLPQASRAVPVDSTEPGELAEGDERAFGLALPRAMRVRARFPDAVHADGKVGFVALANYVRQRLSGAQVDTGPSRTVFDDAVPKGDRSKRVRVVVSSRGGIVRLVVWDRTPEPPEPGLTDAERWRRSGLTPDGKVLPELNE